MATINFVEKNERGVWVIHGELGYKMYYGYTKTEAERMYREEAKATIFKNRAKEA